MDIKKIRCPRCKDMYEYIGSPPKMCNKCAALEETEFLKVRAFVRDRPGISIAETAEETGISHARILRYLREGRLEVAPNSTTVLNCAKCGKVIYTGIYCSKCSSHEGENKTTIIGKVEESAPSAMHTAQNKRPAKVESNSLKSFEKTDNTIRQQIKDGKISPSKSEDNIK